MCAYAYLDKNLQKKAENIDKKDYTVPYEKLPDNKGIAFVLPDNCAVLAYLDFEEKSVKVLQIENFDDVGGEYFGYTCDYTVNVDYNLLSGIIDRTGGVNLNQNGETLRFTGVQVVDLLSVDNSGDIKKQLPHEIFNQISNNGFSKDDFLYLIKNADTDLKITDCIYWIDYFDKITKNVIFVNQGKLQVRLTVLTHTQNSYR